MRKEMDCDKILELHANTVYKVAMSQVKNPDDAKDIFQEVFLRLVKYQKDFESDEHLKAWLIRVTINCCKDFFKNRYNANKQELVVEIPFEDPTHHEVFYYVQELDEKYKVVIHLFYYEQYSIADIAKLLDTNESTIKTRLSRARENLKKRMERDLDA
ncbi:RNA polymerase sigma-70 factor (ECF subfamily) [Breznakia sp. PF5-3]|uniref:RNA polymerase sigma factor n=1 Tax=unclassified Breznakia TaxID=2623764 RepID=UPI0024071A8F|nr:MULTISPECIES: sigma-70 family RNA polymerase sigma factor [unclassified Breznakia]MDF9825730.1 RNA polymerase sigma-70 factor (ECF subfamily) [Breznakia sp. PM6-1]MDF9836076.1 RNA polymerase sigma-70 factor (ECF subfamily) [Breznakia sp. PF5-3]MDF9838295.1 RNA polymerase sigma-70 factor (ECF subfamily) [Breznakia sp. PFB2-8]MDF9860309.1 RNA polymerase sigma-70 factor (ECF subfamily) [Breznakia sp. PH5-24]